MSEPAELELQDLQAWFHTFVVEQGSPDNALAAAEEKAGLKPGSAEELILPSATLNPKERLQIYRSMYLLRMQEALEMDFPAVQARVGDELFTRLVADYVQSHPSQSYTLDHLGRNFSDFLDDIDAAGEGAFLSELARLEWALCMVAIAHDSPTLSMASLSDVPEENFLELSFETVPALSLLKFNHNVNEVYKAWCEDEPPPTVEESDTYIACWRQQLKVWRMNLTEEAFEFLALLTQRVCLGEALDQIIDRFNTSEEKLFEWFQTWIDEGFFQAHRLA